MRTSGTRATTASHSGRRTLENTRIPPCLNTSPSPTSSTSYNGQTCSHLHPQGARPCAVVVSPPEPRPPLLTPPPPHMSATNTNSSQFNWAHCLLLGYEGSSHYLRATPGVFSRVHRAQDVIPPTPPPSPLLRALGGPLSNLHWSVPEPLLRTLS